MTLPPAEKRKGIVWVRPALVAEVEYGNRTADGILRHAVYKGLRSDKAETRPRRRRPSRRGGSNASATSAMPTSPRSG